MRGQRVARRVGVCLALLLLAGCAAEMAQHRGEELATSGRWEEAVQYYLDAVKRDPRNPEFRLGLARAMQEASQELVRQAQELERAERLDEAGAAYRRALSYNAENRTALAGLERLGKAGQVKDRLARARDRAEKNEWRAALAEVNAVLRLDPDHAQAKLLRQEILGRLAGEPVPGTEPDGEQAALRLFPERPVTLRFRDADIKEVLEVFSQTAGVNIVTDEALQPKRVTAYFRDLPLRDALQLILSSNRLFAKRAADNTVIVVPDNPGKRQQYDDLMVQTFYLTDADAKVVVNLLRTILNTRQIFVNEKLNALVIRETPDKIALARKLLEANDRGVGEVEIDLEVLEVDRTSLENLGIDLSPRTYSVTLGLPANIPVGDVWNTIRFGSVLNITNPALILNLVKNDGSTKTLASPTIRILDRQKARLLIGERRPFQISSLTSVPATAGVTATGTTPAVTPTGAVTTTETRVEFRDVGLKLTLTPTVHLNGEVTVELSFEISSVGAPIAGVAGGQLLPPINTRNLDTFIKVKNGETRLLGGLFQETDSVSNNRIPFLSDIPVLGRIFVSGDQSRARTDVLISITPRIVKVLDRPDPDVEGFPSGTADSFGPPAPGLPAPPVAPRPPAAPPAPGGALPPGAAPAPPPPVPAPAPAPSPRP
ncbi:MAG: tetratricopeptide repeat protein [Candidatus Methylomirabilales bacterium]